MLFRSQGIVTELLQLYLSGTHDKKTILVCSGNGLRKNDALKALFARQFGMQAITPVHTEEAAFGASLCGMVAAGAYETIADAQKLIQYATERK